MEKTKICSVFTLTEESHSLKDLTIKRPIAALPFASRYRLIDCTLSSVAAAKIDSVALFIGKSGRSIYDHIRSGKSWGLSGITGGIFTFSQQFYKFSLGMEVGFTEEFYEDLRMFLIRSRARYVFVSGSKTIANVDIKAMREQHVAENAQITRVFSTQKNDYLTMYLLDVDFMLGLIDQAVQEGVFLEATDLVRFYLKKQKLTVSNFMYTGYTAVISSLKDYYQANMDMLHTTHFKELFETEIPIITKEKNGSPTYFGKLAQVKSSMIAADCFVRGKVENSVIFRRVDILEKAEVHHSIIMQECVIEEGAIVEYAILDKGVRVAAGSVIKGTPDQIIVISGRQVVEGEWIKEGE